jgi:hypothetical protein
MQRLIRVFGSLAMIFGFLLLTNFDHDLSTNLASFCGLVAMCGTFLGLYRNGWNRLFYFGLFNVVLVIFNNLLYRSPALIEYLPVVQKITFFSFLVWICSVNIRMEKNRLDAGGFHAG